MLQMGIKELSELQSELEMLKEENKQAEVNLLMEQGLSREKVCFQVSLQAGNDSEMTERNFQSFEWKIFHTCHYLSGRRSGNPAYGHQQPCRAMLPCSIWTSGKHEHTNNDGHG